MQPPGALGKTALRNPPLKVAEAAAELNVHPQRIYDLVEAGIIPHYRFGKRSIRICREGFDKYKASVYCPSIYRCLNPESPVSP